MSNTQPPTVSFVTLGCPKNEADTRAMKNLVEASAYVLLDDGSPADIIVVNTCSFLTSASEEAIDVIFELLDDSELARMGTKVIVAGCMPARYGEELDESLTEAAAFLPCDREARLLDVIEDLTHVRACADLPTLPVCSGAPFAYVKISDGCDRFCSYCTIPFIRGRYHSYSLSQIRSEVASLVESGIAEIILIGQDTGIWGRDFEEPSSLRRLLEDLSSSFPETRFRIMYLQPEGLTDDLLDLMAHTPNICSYLDIPLQHASARILNEMNRKGGGEEYLALIAHVRECVPSIRIRTTFIAGFPGESDEDFAELMRFVDEAQFDYAGVFAYSQEEGTKAGERVDQVAEETKRERAQELRDLCDAIGFARCSGFIGSVEEVIIEGFEETETGMEALGRSAGQAPDVDGLVHIPGFEGALGDKIDVKLVDSFAYEYEAEVVS